MVQLLSTLNDDTVTVVRVESGAPDRWGVPQEIETRSPWKHVNVQQVSTDELPERFRTIDRTVYRVSGNPTPAARAIQPQDRLEWRGDVYEVLGEPDTKLGRLRLEKTVLHMARVTGAQG